MLLLGILLAFGSGVAALIYEVAWFQVLELVVGSAAVSLGILLATFMGGMCLGSWLFPRVFSASRNPLRVYGLIELGIGISGLFVLRLIPLAGSVYSAWSGYGLRGFLLRGLVAVVCLLPPTLLMGATLPALAREAQAAEDTVPWLGFFYGANIAGAVLGCLLAGFYLLRLHDVTVATFAAAGVNLAMASLAFSFSGTGTSLRSNHIEAAAQAAPPGSGIVYFGIALSGLCALAAEAIWTRLLGLLFGASVYAFSIILAVFLAGLGIGSGLGALLCRTALRPRIALGWCQILAVPAMAWTGYNLAASLPYWPITPSLSSDVWFHFQLDLARACWALLPPTVLWGASFPFALRAVAEEKQDPGNLMAGVYASNTLGAIAGALGASLLLIAWIGSQHSEQVLMAVSVIAGLLLLACLTRWVRLSAVAVALLLGVFSIYSLPPVAKVLIAYGRYAATWVGKGDIIYAREGMNSSVAVSRFANGAMTFHVAGKIQASNVARDMRLQRMLGHLTTLTNAHPRSVLVIGCGAGVTAGAVSIDPRVERETIVEIEPLVFEAASRYFSGPNFNVLSNPKVQVHIDDGRHYLMTTRERFDGITIDPLDPWVKGAASFYTREFLETLKSHLNPGGTVTLYVQLFETDLEAVQSAVATFFEVFPNGTIWGNPYRGQGHDMILLGQAEPLKIDLDEMEQRIGYRGGNSPVAMSLAEIGMNSPVDLFATYAGRRSDLTEWLRGASINHDWNLRMQYLAGLGLDRDDAASIYAGMLAHRRFPDGLFFSAEGRVDSLRDAIQRQR
ncbi:MAG TPA: fused MFS/spermidine synthase [Bryobacteraceae bacterium]|nr:fused MFS/spermidine synthase [Bryobacteraceae bacterium]